MQDKFSKFSQNSDKTCNCTESIHLPQLVKYSKLRNSPGLSFHDAFFLMRNGSFPSSNIQNIHRDRVTAANYSPCLMWALPRGVTCLRQQEPGEAHV